ncbi:MAG: dipeptidase, partial [Clostridia bacterium]|nr:dipeptidase [Clostridia bacterium]
RNLTDGQIRLLADCGGVAGLDFCADFLSADGSAEGQRKAILAHARHIVNTGGEDVLALGSDFDGIPQNAYLRSPADMPKLIEELIAEFGSAAAEKITRKNFLRVWQSM